MSSKSYRNINDSSSEGEENNWRPVISATHPSSPVPQQSPDSDLSTFTEFPTAISSDPPSNQSEIIIEVNTTTTISTDNILNSEFIFPASENILDNNSSRIPQDKTTEHNMPSALAKLPIRGKKDAPTTFRGKYTEVERFLRHYNRLLDIHNITKEDDKVEGILEYCSERVKDFIKSTTAYQKPNWDQLQAKMMKYYDAEKQETRYHRSDLIELTRKSRLKTIHTLGQWKKYYRNYTAQANFLKGKGTLSDMEYDGYFLYGVAGRLKDYIEDKLTTTYPDFDTTKPWPVEYITKVAEEYFRRGKFSAKSLQGTVFGSDEESEDSDTEGSSSEDLLDSSDSDSEYEEKKKKKKDKKKQKKKSKKSKKHEDFNRSSQTDDERTRKISAPPEEIEGLITQLNSMSLNDPKYGPTYYKVMQLDKSGLAEKCIMRKPYTEPAPTSGYPVTQNTYRPPFVPPARPSSTYPNNIPIVGNTSTGYGPNGIGNPPFNDYRCFGCLEANHRLSECPKMNEFVKQGVAIYDRENRKFFMTDGKPLFRRNGESLAETVQRMLAANAPQVNFISRTATPQASLQTEVSNFYNRNGISGNATIVEVTSDEEDDYVPYWKQKEDGYKNFYSQQLTESETEEEETYHETYAAEPSTKKTKQARKDVMQNPAKASTSRKLRPSSKDMGNSPSTVPSRSSSRINPEVSGSAPIDFEANLEPVPIDARRIRFPEDIAMENGTLNTDSTSNKQSKDKSNEEKTKAIP